MNRLFVYGIFLDELRRGRYAMSNPEYDTVRDYVTYGDHIVTAYHQPRRGLALTGLTVDVNPYELGERGELIDTWARLDRLEGGYERKVITTTTGVEAYMYVGKGEV